MISASVMKGLISLSVAAKRHKDNNCLKRCYLHCVQSVRIRSFSGPYFSAFELNPEIYGVFNPNAGKADQKNSEYGQFLSSINV